MTSDLANALAVAPVLQQIHVINQYDLRSWFVKGYMTTITSNPALREIRCYGATGKSNRQQDMQEAGLSHQAKQLFNFIETEADRELYAVEFSQQNLPPLTFT